MILFLCLLLPVSLVVFLMHNGGKYIPAVFIGLISALIVCGVNAFFLTAQHIVVYSFKTNFLLYLIKNIFLPVIIVYTLFFLISKDSLDFKIKCFFPLLASFYAVYMPFYIMKGHAVNYSFFELFIQPALILTLISTLSVLIKNIAMYKTNKVLITILSVISILFYMIVPALIQGFYVISSQTIVLTILSVVYIILPLTAFVFKKFFNIELSFFQID